jgi:hypothetical protein
VEILLWLVPPALVTVVAMVWASWAGRPGRGETDRSDAAYARFARAVVKEHPATGRSRPMRVRDRSTGIAVRPSRRTGGTAPRGAGATRRSA